MKNYKTKNSYLKYNVILLFLITIPILSISLLNLIVDPYGIFNTPLINKFNYFKPGQDKHQRLIKSVEIIRYKPTKVLMGASTVLAALNPKHLNINNDSQAYNIGITSANMKEVRLYFDHLILNQPELEEVILGLNFFMFNKNKQNQKFIENNFLLGKNKIPSSYFSKLLLSIDTVKVTALTITTNQRDRSESLHYYDRGMRIPYSLDESNVSRRKKFKTTLSEYLNASYFYKNYQLSQDSLAELEYIVNQCHKNKIKLKVFISPIHAAQLEAIRIAGLWSIFEQWKVEITKITEVWDFSNYDNISTEAIADNMVYFTDSIHYSPNTGDLILNKILSKSSETENNNFGTLINSHNVEQHLLKIRHNQKKWLQNNYKLYRWIPNLKD